MTRPDVAALRELDVLVRNLTDQLAGYRRRALASEARARDLEQQLAGAEGALQELRATAEGVQVARDEALRRVHQLEGQLAASQAAVERARAEVTEVSARSTPEARDQELVRENARLHQRLADARERTAQLGERIRFLRQQVSLGAER